MQKRSCVLVFCVLFLTASSWAKCPDRDSLWKRLVYIRESSISPARQLQELLQYEADIKNCSYQYDSTYAFLLQRIGVAWFKQGDYLKAVQYARQSIRMIMDNAGHPAINPTHNISNYYLLYVSYDALNKVFEKMKALDSLITIAIRFKSVDRLCLTALYKRVEYFYNIGDYQRCMNYITMGEAATREYMRGADSAKYSFYFLGRKVWAQIALKEYDLVKQLLVNKAVECKRAGADNYLGTIYTQLGEVEINEENYGKAIAYYQQALAYEQQFGNNLNCKGILNILGYNIYFRHFNDKAKALGCFRKALQYTCKDESLKKLDAIETVGTLTYVADLYVHAGLYDSAFKYFRSAFDQIRPGMTEEELLHSSLDEFAQQRKIDYLIVLLIDKGDACLKQYKTTGQGTSLREAIRIYKLTDQFLERIRKEQSEFVSKLFWRSDTRRLYEHAIDACNLEGNTEDAFYFFERSRAVLLNDQLNEQDELGEKDILQQTQVKKKILQLEREADTLLRNSARYSEIQTALFDSRQQLASLQSQIKANSPLYYQNNLDTGFIDLEDLRKNILKDHQALLELFAGDSAVYTLLITSAKTYFNKINKADFDSTSRAYIAYISNPALLNSRFVDYVYTAYHLYQLIFQNNPLPAGRIIISPDGHYFPFEGLVTTMNTRPVVYFLNDHAVSYTYSARYLLNDFAGHSSHAPKSFLGVAPVRYASAFSLASLPGSDGSLDRVESYFGNTHTLVADQASRSNFLQQFSKYRIIQLYTHSSDSSATGEPVIYFADSALYLSDLIPENKPATQLVVLSACETGDGKLYQGEGVFSFNRGFAALGIPASITNLWSVDNESTYKITELFYQYLAEGMPTDLALQKAKLEFINHASKEKTLPYYWAAAILAGKTDTIELKKSNSWKYITALIILGTAAFFWWKKRKGHSINPAQDTMGTAA